MGIADKREIARLTLQLERWRDVAMLDGADVTARARREGITVEHDGEVTEEFRQFLREFYA